MAQELIATAADQTIWLLDAPMGAGKTTLVKALMAELGVKDQVSSPTFGLVNQYDLNDGGVVYHFDLYRAESFDELEQIGIWDYVDSGHRCLFEWPDLIKPIFEAQQQPWFGLKISILNQEMRHLVYGLNV